MKAFNFLGPIEVHNIIKPKGIIFYNIYYGNLILYNDIQENGEQMSNCVKLCQNHCIYV